MELPSHPEADEPAPESPELTTSWGSMLVIGLLAGVVVLILVLHLSGVVGPGAH